MNAMYVSITFLLVYFMVGYYCQYRMQQHILDSDFSFEMKSRLLKRADKLIFTWPNIWLGF